MFLIGYKAGITVENTPVRVQDYGIKQQTQNTRIQRYMVNHI